MQTDGYIENLFLFNDKKKFLFFHQFVRSFEHNHVKKGNESTPNRHFSHFRFHHPPPHTRPDPPFPVS